MLPLQAATDEQLWAERYDRAMEEMISQKLFQGVVDLAPGGVGEHLFGFTRDAGPDRLESAGIRLPASAFRQRTMLVD